MVGHVRKTNYEIPSSKRREKNSAHVFVSSPETHLFPLTVIKGIAFSEPIVPSQTQTMPGTPFLKSELFLPVAPPRRNMRDADRSLAQMTDGAQTGVEEQHELTWHT